MKKLTMGALALALTLGCSEGGDTPAGPVDEMAGLQSLEISANELASSEFLDDLTDEDRAAVQAALQAARDQIRAIIDQVRSGALSRDAAEVQIRAVHDGLIDTLADVLTSDQIDALLQRRDRPGHRPDLDLTEEQIREIRALLHMFHVFVREVRARVEGGDLTPQEGRRLVRAKAQETREAICAVLEPNQQAKVPFCRGPVGGPGNGPPGGSPPGQG